MAVSLNTVGTYQVAFNWPWKKIDPEKKAGEILSTEKDNINSISIANKIKRAAQSKNDQAAIINAIEKNLLGQGYGEADVKKLSGDIRKQLGILNQGTTIARQAKVQSKKINSGALSAEIVSVRKTGGIGNDNVSPEVIVTMRISGLPDGASSLSGFVRTNQDWPFGSAQTGGRTSGDFTFKGWIYPSNIGIDNRFFIKIYGDGGKELGRIPSNNLETIRFIPSTYGITLD